MAEEQTTTEAGTQTPTITMDDVKTAVSESLSQTTRSIDERFSQIEGRFNQPKEEAPDWEMPDNFYDLDKDEQKRVFETAVNTKVSAVEKKLSQAIEGTQMQTAKVYARQLVPTITERASKDIPDELKPLAQKYLTERLNQAAEKNPGVFQDIPDSEIENIRFQALGYAMSNKGKVPQDATPAGANQAASSNAVDEKIRDYWQSKTGSRDIPQKDLERIRKNYSA